jgi:hypothetical protein
MDKERAGTQSVEVGFAQPQGLTRSRRPLMLKDLATPVDMGTSKAHHALGTAAPKLDLTTLPRLNAVRPTPSGVL